MPLEIIDAKALKDFLKNATPTSNKTQHDCAGSRSCETTAARNLWEGPKKVEKQPLVRFA